MDCLKTIFPHKSAFIIEQPKGIADGVNLSEVPWEQLPEEFKTSSNRLVSSIKKSVSHKLVCGKAINGNMLLALSLEYAEILSAPNQGNLSLPGNNKSSMIGNLQTLFTAFSRVSEEEMVRIFDLVYTKFQSEISDQVNEETLPLS